MGAKSPRRSRPTSTHDAYSAVVYDPNTLNPYGTELAAVIAEASGDDVLLLVTPERARTDIPRVGTEARIPSASVRGIKKMRLRIMAPWWACRRAASLPLIVVWTRDAWDAALFSLRATTGRPTYFVYHNPPSIRPRSGLSGLMERVLAKSSIVSVHSQHLSETLEGLASRRVVTPHPTYRVTTASSRSPQVRRRKSGSPPTVALVGALRADKGIEDLPEIARACSMRWRLVTLGPDVLSPGLRAELEKSGLSVHSPGGRLTDEQLHRAMADADVILAPYRQVTESGTAMLALTLGTPLLGLRSPAFEQLLTEESIADSPAELGIVLANYLSRPWITFRTTEQQRHSEALAAWKRSLDP